MTSLTFEDINSIALPVLYPLLSWSAAGKTGQCWCSILHWELFRYRRLFESSSLSKLEADDDVNMDLILLRSSAWFISPCPVSPCWLPPTFLAAHFRTGWSASDSLLDSLSKVLRYFLHSADSWMSLCNSALQKAFSLASLYLLLMASHLLFASTLTDL